MKVFITGATGFIGSHVSAKLLEDGHELTVLARDPNKIPAYLTHPNIEVLHADLNDHEAIAQGMQNCEACVHVALGWGEKPLAMLDADLRNTVFLLQTALKYNYKQFLFTSSTAAMGELRLEMTENSPLRPNDFYGASKASAEAFVIAMGANGFMRCNVIRPGYTYGNPAFPEGPTQPDGRFRNIVRLAKTNQKIQLIANDGTQFLWAGDLAKVYSEVLKSDFNRETFLCLANRFYTWQAIAEKAIELTGSSSEIELIDKGWGEAPCHFKVDKLERELQFSFDPEVEIENHIKHLIEIL